MDYKERALELFKKDKYALETTGVTIEEVDEYYCKCSLKIEEKHLNYNGVVMGGAIFTLADLAFGIAANIPVSNCVTLSSSVSFARPAFGPVLYAVAKCVKDGRRICFYDVMITDDKDKLIASFSMSGFRSEDSVGYVDRVRAGTAELPDARTDLK